MSDDDTLAERLRRLNNRATPAPWCAGWAGDPLEATKDDAAPLSICSLGRGGVADMLKIASGHAKSWEVVETNAKLITELRNNLPEIISALEQRTPPGKHGGRRPGAGRPRRGALRANKRLCVRVTTDEYARLEDAATDTRPPCVIASEIISKNLTKH